MMITCRKKGKLLKFYKVIHKNICLDYLNKDCWSKLSKVACQPKKKSERIILIFILKCIS